ncbi:MAG: 50S ribosomal protein L23 [Kiritimatiellae bacterium]|jgi:large subunit ribosomal protein L23|nr:50S ribosomal protein L23 [Kiritimatiellia bacterium]
MKSPHVILQTLRLSEKGSREIEKHNCYFFKVDPAANKLEIKRAVEEIFKVHVAGVNTMNCRGKKKRERSMKYGRTSSYKKAMVTLRKGEKIEIA